MSECLLPLRKLVTVTRMKKQTQKKQSRALHTKKGKEKKPKKTFSLAQRNFILKALFSSSCLGNVLNALK